MEELGESERARLAERFGRSYGPGDTIYDEGEDVGTCFVVQTGRVRLVKRVRSVERGLTVLKAGDLFGEGALLNRTTSTSTAVALTDVSLLALDAPTFTTMLADNPEVASRLVRQLIQRLRDAEDQLENAMLRDRPSKVVNTLLRLARNAPTDRDEQVLEVSPLELSSKVGIDVDGLKRIVLQLREGGYLRIEDERIMIPDLEALRRLYDLLGMKEEIRGGFG